MEYIIIYYVPVQPWHSPMEYMPVHEVSANGNFCFSDPFAHNGEILALKNAKRNCFGWYILGQVSSDAEVKSHI